MLKNLYEQNAFTHSSVEAVHIPRPKPSVAPKEIEFRSSEIVPVTSFPEVMSGVTIFPSSQLT